ncbi:MAG: DUF2125 domain-containing protein [Pseudomonadota bacterium]
MMISRIGAALALSAAPVAAWAEIAPRTYLEELTALYAAQGIALTHGDVQDQGDGVLVPSVMLASEGPDTAMEIALGDMTIRPTMAPGYDLEVLTAPQATGTVTGTAPDAPAAEIELTMTLEGSYWVGGAENARKIELAYPAIDVTMDIASEADLNMQLDMGFQDTAGTIGYALSDRSIDYRVAAGRVTAEVTVPETDGAAADISATYDDVQITSQAVLTDTTDPLAIYATDMLTTAELTAASSAIGFRLTGAGPEITGTLTGGSSGLDIGVGAGGLDYAISGEAVDVDVQGGALPVPVIGSMARYLTRIALPVIPDEDLSDIVLDVSIEDLTLDDALWGLFDPGAAIPRDPVSLRLDLTAQGRALTNVMTPEEAMPGEMPYEFGSVSLNTLELRGAGVDISGSGQADILNDGPFPQPVGAVDLRIAGLGGLLDTLSASGLVGPGQLLPVQIMLGTFAQPTDESDVFTSRIEADAEGRITANGVALQ